MLYYIMTDTSCFLPIGAIANATLGLMRELLSVLCNSLSHFDMLIGMQ